MSYSRKENLSDKMKYLKLFTVVYAASHFISTMPAVAAGSNEAIATAIVSAKIMAEGYKVGALNNLASHEVIVSTYANAKSKNVLNDCKIDALLIAKKVLEVEPQTVRVKVRFYSPTQESYQQITVTKPELAAFSIGSVNKDELLLSLEVITVSTKLHQTTTINATTRATRLATGNAAHSDAGTASADGLVSYNLQGLKFSSAKTWKAKDMKNEYGDFLELWRDRTAWHSIMFRLQDRESPGAVAEEDDRLFFSLHSHRITGRSEVMIGRLKNIRALVLRIKDEENPKESDRYETHVYFGNPHRVYSMSVRYCGADAETVNEDLNLILSSIVM